MWERRSGVQAGGGPCLSGDVLSVAYDGVSPSCCPRRGWPGSYAGLDGSGRAQPKVVDASSGGQGPSSAADMEGEKEESEPERERRHKTKGSGEEATAQPFVLSDGLAPVPAKLVERILRGDFVDMAELLRDNLEAQRRGVIQESSAISSDLKRGRREVPDLLSWVQCFGTYMAVVTSAQPTKGAPGLPNPHCPRGTAVWW